jgi:hypothetical protein
MSANPYPNHQKNAPPADVTLLLRAHAERHWLSREVIPVLRQVETCRELPEEQLPAATAYLEVIWAEALGRARETDAEHARFQEPADAAPAQPAAAEVAEVDDLLVARARHYYAVVRALRETVARRVAPVLAAPAAPEGALARGLLHGNPA